MFSIHCNNCVRAWKVKKDMQRKIKIKSFINKHNQKGINIPSEKRVRKNIEEYNVAIADNVLYTKAEK